MLSPARRLAGRPAEATERNFWPFKVEQTAIDRSGVRHVEAWQGGGPLFFGKLLPEGGFDLDGGDKLIVAIRAR